MAFQESELLLQRKVHNFLSDPSKFWVTTANKKIQIISCGTINVYEGPDFIDMAIVDGSTIVVGHGEFHRKSSDFVAHKHTDDVRYQQLCVHIVFENDVETSFAEHTIVLNKEDISAIQLPVLTQVETVNDLEDIQQFSLKRLLRKSSEVKKVLDSSATVTLGITNVIHTFLEKFLQKRTRPRTFTQSLDELSAVSAEKIYSVILPLLQSESEQNLPTVLLEFEKKQLPFQGAHLGREIILNCVLPIALCLGNDLARIQLFNWYWSTNALHSYGFLKRKYPHISQNYLWQQQGLLEYNAYYGPKKTGVAELTSTYSIAETLDFYRLAILPIDSIAQISGQQL
jgi:predicted MarR family transcription regulator